MRLGTTEIILIVVLALVLFGGGKLAGVGKALGKSDWVHQAILALCVLFLSPLGYLVVKCLTALSDLAVAALMTAA